MGRKLVVPGLSLTDLTAPKIVTIDQIESAGSLLLVEPMHPTMQWAAGVPANGASLPNLLWETAAAVYGEGTQTSLAMTLGYAGMTGATGLVERTSKGGLHGIVSQADAMTEVSGSPYLQMVLDAHFRKWQRLHPTNDLFVSLWGRVTRPYRAGTIGSYTGLGGTTILSLRTGGSNQRITRGNKNGANEMLGGRNNAENISGPAIVNAASSSWLTAPATDTSVASNLITVGNAGDNNAYHAPPNTARARWASWVIYRLYIEDLTVSGRSYTEVDAIDNALYEKHVLTAGGRYYGDTWTDPATLP